MSSAVSNEESRNLEYIAKMANFIKNIPLSYKIGGSVVIFITLFALLAFWIMRYYMFRNSQSQQPSSQQPSSQQPSSQQPSSQQPSSQQPSSQQPSSQQPSSQQLQQTSSQQLQQTSSQSNREIRSTPPIECTLEKIDDKLWFSECNNPVDVLIELLTWFVKPFREILKSVLKGYSSDIQKLFKNCDYAGYCLKSLLSGYNIKEEEYRKLIGFGFGGPLETKSLLDNNEKKTAILQDCYRELEGILEGKEESQSVDDPNPNNIGKAYQSLNEKMAILLDCYLKLEGILEGKEESQSVEDPNPNNLGKAYQSLNDENKSRIAVLLDRYHKLEQILKEKEESQIIEYQNPNNIGKADQSSNGENRNKIAILMAGIFAVAFALDSKWFIQHLPKPIDNFGNDKLYITLIQYLYKFLVMRIMNIEIKYDEKYIKEYIDEYNKNKCKDNQFVLSDVSKKEIENIINDFENGGVIGKIESRDVDRIIKSVFMRCHVSSLTKYEFPTSKDKLEDKCIKSGCVEYLFYKTLENDIVTGSLVKQLSEGFKILFVLSLWISLLRINDDEHGYEYKSHLYHVYDSYLRNYSYTSTESTWFKHDSSDRGFRSFELLNFLFNDIISKRKDFETKNNFDEYFQYSSTEIILSNDFKKKWENIFKNEKSEVKDIDELKKDHNKELQKKTAICDNSDDKKWFITGDLQRVYNSFEKFESNKNKKNDSMTISEYMVLSSVFDYSYDSPKLREKIIIYQGLPEVLIFKFDPSPPPSQSSSDSSEKRTKLLECEREILVHGTNYILKSVILEVCDQIYIADDDTKKVIFMDIRERILLFYGKAQKI